MLIEARTFDALDGDFDPQFDPLLKRIYLARGVTQQAALQRQLSCLPSPSSMLGIDTAVAILAAALVEQKRVLIVGDFDADGATSSALMVLALTAMGYQHVDFLVPNRFDYGYGLTPEIVDLAAEREPQLLITVDNGISSIDGVKKANALGMQVIVTDHHLPGAVLPDAAAIVNPNQPGCTFVTKNLAGVGVAFYLLSALRGQLRRDNWFDENTIAEPNMATWLDLVALGTVADVVPLDQINRALVHQGLMRIRAGQCRPGIKALLTIAGKNPQRLVATDLGFALGPRLNAAGRLDDISLGIQCLLTSDPQLAMDTARELDELNQDRKVIEQDMQREALKIVEQIPLSLEGEVPPALCLFQAEWHQGVVGLLASRIKEKYHRPVIAFARGDNGQLKGSSRSIPGLHIRDALDAVASQNPGLISKFGGHAMAAGLSLDEDKLPAFKEAFQRQVAQLLSADDLQAKIATDGELIQQQLSMQTAELLRDSGPWGQLFPEPCFEGEFEVLQQRIVGEKHLKLVLAPVSETGQKQPYAGIDGIWFNADTEVWPSSHHRLVRCVYRLDINEYRGQQSLQLMIQFLEPLVR
ncbi:RecJ exonuclease [marine gamma proteobacterium HTCC2207]|jgi:single-stranded-DNA-specific exonuclease|uniref:Single-stranded-DNA-specific exonuclease RecJ n=1 Tax=gamma proteobacterium HTCC2207 TaxID=314287 RepID=Q1YR03_9GAMM|nr:RecJ exonuclease [marine gamma proteobacterium HTCC2207] [gamma proteobacterium HTCC2207]MBT5106142.1 single-stranded-DNA-specific exonuclease RecJ [Porticoccaceae bacterium]MBT6116086.1 single-stranded-DNA-specific exonuclease RecJ [Porticoccaceae bacterium]MDG1080682.1 single-stranded-DNA-specific exonuclease RecJ [Porticoccaceae bacterium]